MNRTRAYAELTAGTILLLICFPIAGYGAAAGADLGARLLLLVPCALGIWIAFKWLINPAFQRLQPTAEELLAADGRPPVLFLRSFLDDTLEQDMGLPASAPLVLRVVPKWSAEASVTLFLRWIGPVIAIGKPGEHLPQLGASRAYVSDAEWKGKIASWTPRCRLIVMMANNATPGTQWELLHTRDTVGPERFVLFFPPDLKERERAYEQYRQMVAGHLPKPLPAELGAAQFVRFDPEWNPELVTDAPALARLLVPNFKRPSLAESYGRPRMTLVYVLLAGGVLEIAVLLYLLITATP